MKRAAAFLGLMGHFALEALKAPKPREARPKRRRATETAADRDLYEVRAIGI